MKPAKLTQGALISWSPSLVARMLIGGVLIEDYRQVPRREVHALLWRSLRAWWAWTVALPGDLFEDLQRDLILRVEHGLPGRRTVRAVTRQAMRYPTVRTAGLDALFAVTPAEPCRHGWSAVNSIVL